MKNNFKFFMNNRPVNPTDITLSFELEFELNHNKRIISFRDDCDNLNDEQISFIWNKVIQSGVLDITDETRKVYINKEMNDGEWLLTIYNMDEDGDLVLDTPEITFNNLLQII